MHWIQLPKYLFYILILDFTLESLDQIHRIYEADESFDILKILVRGKLFFTFFIMQIGIGTLIPLTTLGFLQFKKPRIRIRKILYLIISVCRVSWDILYEMERSYRRSAFLKKFLRIYQL